jgi:hypothetical protein
LKSKFWKKLNYIDDATELFKLTPFKNSPLQLPESVVRFHLPQKRLFGTPIEDLVVVTPTGIVLPPILIRTVTYLCEEGIYYMLCIFT